MKQATNRRLNVLYVLTRSNWGGAQRYVYDLATNLSRDRFDAAVALGGEGQLAEKLRERKIIIYHNFSLGRDVSLVNDAKSFFELYRLFKNIRPDIVHLNSSKAAALGAIAARLARMPKIVFTVHGWPFGEKRNVLEKLIIWKISWLTALLSHHVICVSDYDLGIAKRMPFIVSKAVRIYNGIDLSMQFGSGDIIRKAFPHGVKITGMIGELTKNKNQIALIEQARKNSDMYVAIVGEGEDRTMLISKIKEYRLENRVKLFGFLPSRDALKGFDTFALPSLKEGLPYVLLEAKLADLPITANRVGGVPEILDKDISEFSFGQMLEQTLALYRE